MREVRVHLDLPLASGRRIALPPQAAQHVMRVLRLRSGAALTVFDGRGGEYTATLELAGRDTATVEIGEHRSIERESPLRITLLQGLARGERMDWVVQKATELGVRRIVPVATARSVVQLDTERGSKRTDHWLAIAAAACEQCGRNTLPEIAAPLSFEAALRETAAIELRLALHPDSWESLRTVLGAHAARPETVLLIGPEGGLDETEIALARQGGFRVAHLGPRVLRTETAGIAALAALQCLAGDLT
jgi:16S rRNA (uracil1498-N3)-methyltransferase